VIRQFIDTNSIGFAAHSAKTRLSAGEQDTTGIFNAMRAMRDIVSKRAGALPVCLLDGRSWRHDFYSEYKGTRDDNPVQAAARVEYRKIKQIIERGFTLLGVPQAIVPNWEADDLAAFFTRKAVEAGDKVILISADKDWLQLVQPGVIWVDRTHNRTCTVRNFRDLAKVATVREFVELKALCGDTGDNIKGVPGIGEKGALEFLSVFGSVDAFLTGDLNVLADQWFLATGAKKLPKKFTDFHTDPDKRAQYEHDLALVDLYSPKVPKGEKLRVIRGPVDVEGFKTFCNEFGFTSIARDVEAFVAPFQISKDA
jgi:5'-3' exonuclease